jgi:hypothetical protein
METLTEVQEIKSSRRGVNRPGYNGTHLPPTLAAATNELMALVKTNIAKSADARRWRDLMLSYRDRLGDRINQESVRVRVLALVNLTLELERITDGLVAGRQGKLIRKSGVAGAYGHQTLMYRQGDAHLVIHISGQIQTLLKSLGLDKEDKGNAKQSGEKK